MRYRSSRPTKVKVMSLLFMIAALGIILPPTITSSIHNLMQILVPAQHSLSAMSNVGSFFLAQPKPEDEAELLKKLQAYGNHVASLTLRVKELEETNLQLSRLQSKGLHVGRLISAHIVAADSLPWRESRLLDQGTLRGVRQGQSVTSNFFVTVGSEEGVTEGMNILTGEVLVGEIFRAGTHTSQVLLLSDPASWPRPVKIGRMTETSFSEVPSDFLLHGIGNGLMQINDVDRNLINQQAIEVGDWVLSNGSDSKLPVSMVIGTVQELVIDDNNPALYRLIVTPVINPSLLKNVYVVANDPT